MRWRDEFDPVLKKLHKRGLFDQAITNFMLDQGFPVSIEDVRVARRRLGLEANKRPPVVFRDEPGRLPKQRENPIQVAREWLGSRLEERPGGYWLDNRPVNLAQIMRAVNRMRLGMGVDQIGANEAWRT